MNKKTIYIEPLGCMMRDIEAERLKNFFLKNNYKITNDKKDAYYRIIVTCSLNDEKINTSMQAINISETFNGVTFITGCLPTMEPNRFLIKEKTILIPIKELHHIENYFKNIVFKYVDIEDSNFYREKDITGRNDGVSLKNVVSGFDFNKRYLIKFTRKLRIFLKKYFAPKIYLKKATIRISTGCLYNCAFCGIKFGIGNLKSKPKEKILYEYKNLINFGYSNIFLLGDDTGAYGVDIKSSIPELLSELNKIKTNKKIKWYFQDLNPYWAKKYMEEMLHFVRNKYFYELLFAIQSGSDKILKLMNRNYSVSDVILVLNNYKNANSYLRILGNFIVGFPNETEDDFKLTLKLCQDFKFDFIYIMPYYENSVCDSRNIYPKVTKQDIENRLKSFEVLLKKQKTDYRITPF